MEWKNWSYDSWVLEADDGEVLDFINKHLDGLFRLKSNNKIYTSLEAAKKARINRKESDEKAQ